MNISAYLPPRPICADQGFKCDQLPERVYNFIADCIRIPLALFVLYISMVKLRDEIVKWYTVFLYAFLMPYFFICVIFSSADIYSLYSSELQFLFQSQDAFLVIAGRFLNGLSHFQFRALSLYMILVFLLSYKTPTKFRKYFASSVKLPFGLITTGVLIVDAPSLYSIAIGSYFNDTREPECTKVIAIVGVWTDIIVNLIIATISAVLIFLALFAIVRFQLQPKSPNLSRNSRTASLYQLIQFVIFFAPLAIIQISSYALNWFFVLRHILPSLTPILREKYGVKVLEITMYTQEISLTLMPFCTLLALSPYRKAVMKLMHCERHVKPMGTKPAMERVLTAINGQEMIAFDKALHVAVSVTRNVLVQPLH